MSDETPKAKAMYTVTNPTSGGKLRVVGGVFTKADEKLAWHYGPTADDPDPGKMWHYDCGGLVMYIDNGWVCCGCDAQMEDE